MPSNSATPLDAILPDENASELAGAPAPAVEALAPESLVTEALGSVIRRLREGKGLSVRALARETDFSPSFISQVENGLSSPSIGSMGRIAQALGVSLSEIFAREPVAAVREPGLEIVRSDERARYASSWSRGHLLLFGSRDQPRQLDPAILALEATGQSSGRTAASGYDTFAFVLDGQVILHLDTQDVTLATEDSALIGASLAHRWANPFTSPTRILLVTVWNSSPAG